MDPPIPEYPTQTGGDKTMARQDHIKKMERAEQDWEQAKDAGDRKMAGAEIRHRIRCLRAWESWERGDITKVQRIRVIKNSAISRWQDMNRTRVPRWLQVGD
jgi:hypothetical protein